MAKVTHAAMDYDLSSGKMGLGFTKSVSDLVTRMADMLPASSGHGGASIVVGEGQGKENFVNVTYNTAICYICT
jgi:hypothetical protein